MCTYIKNKFYKTIPNWDIEQLSFLKNSDMRKFHQSLDGYCSTPLVSLKKTAKTLGVKNIYAKDESKRFDIKAFKALGASYAIYRFMKKMWDEKYEAEFTPELFEEKEVLKKLGAFTFCAASDGNHGRAVAWTAKMLHQKAVIYMPHDTVPARIKNIESEGARVKVLDGTYDDCVQRISEDAKKNGWIEVGDTAYYGYTEIPSWVLNGYSTIFEEINEQCNVNEIDIVILQAGVGAFAAAGVSWFVKKLKEHRPKLISVEPLESAGFLESVEIGDGNPHPAKGTMETIMAGLNCGMPSIAAWPVIRDSVDAFIAISDHYAKDAMKQYAKEGIISGESGASGLAGLLAIMRSEKLQKLKNDLGINEESTVLVISTEGDTDPEHYKEIVERPSS